MRVSGRSTLALALGLVAIGMGAMIITGVSAVSAAAVTAVIAIQALTGSYWWRRIAPYSPSPIEAAGMGIAVGSVMSLVSSLVVITLGLGTWGWLLPPALTLLLWIGGRIRGRASGQPRSGIGAAEAVGLGIGAIAGLAGFAVNVTRYPLTWDGAWGGYHPDMLFFEALATSVARFGPADSIFLVGGSIRYHWLVYAWAGQVTEAAGAEPFVVLTRALPLVATAIVVLLGIAWARRLCRVPWVPSLAVLLLISGGYVGASYGTILNFDSPSQALTSAWLLAFCLAVLAALEPGRSPSRSLPSVIAVGGLAFAITGGKVSSGAVAVAGAGVVWLVALLRREVWHRRALGALSASLVGSAMGYLLVVAGSADPGGLRLAQLLDRASSVQGLNPVNYSLGIALGTAILLVAIVIRWSGLAWLVADRADRWQPSTMLGVGFALAGIGTVILISGGLNDTWFALAASAPLSVLSAVGVGRAATAVGLADPGTRPSRPLVLAVVVGLAAAIVAAVLWMSGGSGGNVWVSTWRWLGPLAAVALAVAGAAAVAADPRTRGRYVTRWLALTVIILAFSAVPFRLLGVAADRFGVRQEGLAEVAFEPKVPFVSSLDDVRVNEWTAEENAAAAWLRRNAAPDEIIATNITFSPLVPALTGLRSYVAGIQYQAPYGRPAQLPVLVDRELQAWSFIDTPTVASARDLCSAGVQWVWVDPTRTTTRQWAPWAIAVWSADDVVVLRMADCP